MGYNDWRGHKEGSVGRQAIDAFCICAAAGRQAIGASYIDCIFQTPHPFSQNFLRRAKDALKSVQWSDPDLIHSCWQDCSGIA